MSRLFGGSGSLRCKALCLCILLTCVPSWSQHIEIIHNLGSSPEDGSIPLGGVVADSKGSLYGTTTDAGNGGCQGTVYELAPPTSSGTGWTETILYRCTGLTGGDGLEGNVVFDAAGNLYFTAGYGGNQSCLGGCGMVVELTPTSPGQLWMENDIYLFSGPDGQQPLAGLILDGHGNLYGTASAGGQSGSGLVFELSPPAAPGGTWSETVLHDFTGGDDGGLPAAPLLFDAAGNLYSTTYKGGSMNAGTVFELSSTGNNWNETVLHNFGASNDGANPALGGLITDRAGNLYGTTQRGGSHGGGTAFMMGPPGEEWGYQILYSFGASSKDGQIVQGGLALSSNGALYGTTDEGGIFTLGTIFRLSPVSGGSWRERILHNFGDHDSGAGFPEAGVLIYKSALFGTASTGGAGTDGQGAVYQLLLPYPVAPSH
jgi:uncharacterized repeat protein (TIGR03803 family)